MSLGLLRGDKALLAGRQHVVVLMSCMAYMRSQEPTNIMAGDENETVGLSLHNIIRRIDSRRAHLPHISAAVK